MTYYIAENNGRRGPFSLEQLATMSIDSDTLVWTEGMETWERAGDQEVLRAIIISRSSAKASAFQEESRRDEYPPLPRSEAGVILPEHQRKRHYGCFLTLLVVIGGLIAALWFTNPKPEAHKEALTSLADDVVRNEMSNLTGGLGTSVAQSIVGGVLNTFFDDAFKTYDYHLFSVTKFDLGKNDKIVTVGLLGHVFTANKDVVSNYIHKKIGQGVKEQIDNLKKEFIPSSTLRNLFDRFIGGAINEFLGTSPDDDDADSE